MAVPLAGSGRRPFWPSVVYIFKLHAHLPSLVGWHRAIKVGGSKWRKVAEAAARSGRSLRRPRRWHGSTAWLMLSGLSSGLDTSEQAYQKGSDGCRLHPLL